MSIVNHQAVNQPTNPWLKALSLRSYVRTETWIPSLHFRLPKKRIGSDSLHNYQKWVQGPLQGQFLHNSGGIRCYVIACSLPIQPSQRKLCSPTSFPVRIFCATKASRNDSFALRKTHKNSMGKNDKFTECTSSWWFHPKGWGENKTYV